MTEMERIEKTTEIFRNSKGKSITKTFNEAQSVIDDYFNEHFGNISALEMPFVLKNLEERISFYKKELEQHPDLMLLYGLLGAFKVNDKTVIAKLPNLFNKKAGDNDD